MTNTTFSLTRASLIWRPGHVTRTRGYGIISAVAYDGTRGILPAAPLPPIPFHRRPRRGYDFIAPGSAEAGNDGVLIATFEQTPRAVGWAITLTLTRTLEQANDVAEAARTATEAVLSAFAGKAIAKVVHEVAGAVVTAVDALTAPRIVGTWVNSESDVRDLRRDWITEYESFKAYFELEYDVTHEDEAEGEDD